MTIALTTPPAPHSLPRPHWWRCQACGGKLGMVHANRVSIRIGRRQIEAPLPVSQVCDRCGTFNRLDTAPGTEGR